MRILTIDGATFCTAAGSGVVVAVAVGDGSGVAVGVAVGVGIGVVVGGGVTVGCTDVTVGVTGSVVA